MKLLLDKQFSFMLLQESDYSLLIDLYASIELYAFPDAVAAHPINMSELPDNTTFPLIVLCVSDQPNQLSDKEKILLQKILEYTGFSIDTIPVFVCDKEHPITLSQLMHRCYFKQLIIFGGNRKMQYMQIDIGKGYMPIELCEKKIYFAHSLNDLDADSKKKRLLQEMIKTYFLSGK